MRCALFLFQRALPDDFVELLETVLFVQQEVGHAAGDTSVVGDIESIASRGIHAVEVRDDVHEHFERRREDVSKPNAVFFPRLRSGARED